MIAFTFECVRVVRQSGVVFGQLGLSRVRRIAFGAGGDGTLVGLVALGFKPCQAPPMRCRGGKRVALTRFELRGDVCGSRLLGFELRRDMDCSRLLGGMSGSCLVAFVLKTSRGFLKCNACLVALTLKPTHRLGQLNPRLITLTLKPTHDLGQLNPRLITCLLYTSPSPRDS